jgi:ribosomal protein S18 acetylase RimI-like enzyme
VSAEIEFFEVDPASGDAAWAMRQYFEELDRRFLRGFDVEAAASASVSSLRPPSGNFLVARRRDEVVACGGVQWLDEGRGEIKRMWVSPAARGVGLGRRLLERLEHEVAGSGRSTVLLDTNAVLSEAIAMYRRCGYVDVERYNDNPDAELWFEKRLELDPS